MRDAVGRSLPDGVIDLDVECGLAARSATGPWRRWRRLATAKVPVFGVVTLVVLGALAGAAGGWQWTVAQQRSRDASVVSLFAAVAELESGGGWQTSVTIEGTVAVVNGGPLPVDVSVVADSEDFRVKGQRRIAPGATDWFPVTATVWCSDDAAVRPVPVALHVVTADGVGRVVTVQLQLSGSPWAEFVMQSCLPPR
ncbi:hypothetical protein [Dactylosporangium sp. CA-139066]|uniref:hypothetical protein n=1 Tax=Dactylosporangium sp. CA-139066 TaxID=3239930 RepID=UPI003D9280F7